MPKCQNDTRTGDVATRIAKECGLSRSTVIRAGKYAAAVDAIAQNVSADARTRLLSCCTGLAQKDVLWIAENLTPEAQRTLFDMEPDRIKVVCRNLRRESPEDMDARLLKQALGIVAKIESPKALAVLVDAIRERF